MIKNFKIIVIIFIVLALNACFSVKYSFTGASIPPAMKSLSVEYFTNRASIVNPNLSQQFTNALMDKFRQQTSLIIMNEGGEGDFQGEITGYTTAPMAITGDQAAKTRFTISIHVKYTNTIEPKNNFDKTFSRFEDYDSKLDLHQVEDQMVVDIINLLTEDIFNQAFVNW